MVNQVNYVPENNIVPPFNVVIENANEREQMVAILVDQYFATLGIPNSETYETQRTEIVAELKLLNEDNRILETFTSRVDTLMQRYFVGNETEKLAATVELHKLGVSRESILEKQKTRDSKLKEETVNTLIDSYFVGNEQEKVEVLKELIELGLQKDEIINKLSAIDWSVRAERRGPLALLDCFRRTGVERFQETYNKAIGQEVPKRLSTANKVVTAVAYAFNALAITIMLAGIIAAAAIAAYALVHVGVPVALAIFVGFLATSIASPMVSGVAALPFLGIGYGLQSRWGYTFNSDDIERVSEAPAELTSNRGVSPQQWQETEIYSL